MPKATEKRIKSACSPCHRRKRKCNGLNPCNTCKKDGYECHYRTLATVRTEGLETTSNIPPVGSKGRNNDLGPPEHVAAAAADQRSVMANSGPLFVRHLLKKIDPTHAPTTQLSAWNVGSREGQEIENIFQSQSQPPVAASITNLISQAQMTTLADVYFEKIDPCYGFLDREVVQQQVDTRWLLPPYTSCTYDAVLCGIAALGSYFSKAHAVPVESQLVQLARSILHSSTLLKVPNQETVTAWVCHVVYMRLTATPAAAWIASCTAMHILEAAGMHQDHPKDDAVLGQLKADHDQPPSVMPWRAFGVAQHLNTWISYDLGLSRVSLRPPTPVETTSPADSENYTDKLLQLLPASLILNRTSNENDDDSLRSTLMIIAAKSDSEPPLIMAQCNLILCILRQLCSRNSLRSNGEQEMNAALGALKKALAAARQMIEDDTPWHQLANVPFQTLCMLLAIDTPKSLAMVEEAVQTIQQVKGAYNTLNLIEACNTAHLIIYLHRKRRLDDVQVMDKVLSALLNDSGGVVSSVAPVPDANGRSSSFEWDAVNATEMDISWFNDFLGEFPSLQPFTTSNMFETNFMS